MSLKIYTVHHAVPQWYMATEVFQPFIVGAAGEGALDPAFQTDREAPTFADQHSFAEMRCHYWVWKHLPDDVDYIGFQHYRRAFVSALTGGAYAEVRADRQYFMARDPAVTASWLRGLLDHCDIIVPRKWPAEPDLGADYCRSQRKEDWQVLLAALPSRSPDLAARIDYIYRCNMFVMRVNLFDLYMTWWHEIMTKLVSAITPPAEGYQSRTFGFMSERLFTLWMANAASRAGRELRLIELPLLVGNFTAI